MKAFSKITILAAAAAFLCSCEMEYYKEELYRKEIFIVSGENNILGQEFEYGEKGFQGSWPSMPAARRGSTRTLP